MHALIVGKRRMGKSTLALALGRVHSNIIIVWDPNTQFRDFGDPVSIDQINQRMAYLSSEEAEPLEQPLVMVFRPTTGQFHEDFDEFAEMLWQWDGFSLVVDESTTLQSSHAIHPKLDRFIRQAPAGISILQTCHRVNDLNRLSRALCTDYFFFRSTQKKDVSIMAVEFDDRLERVLPSLQKYELVHHWQGKGGVDEISIWRDPKIWFVELGHGETEGDHGGARNEDEGDDVPATGQSPLADFGTVPSASDRVHRDLESERG